MAETIAIGFDVDQSQLQSTIDLMEKLGQIDSKTAATYRAESEKTRAALGKGLNETSQSFGKLDTAIKNVGVNAKVALAFDKSKEVLKTAESMVSLRQQMKAAVNETATLAAKYGELDSRTIAAAKNAANLKERFSDVNKQIAALNPEAKFTAFSQLGGVLAGAFQTATGALQAFGVESETATKLAQQFQGAINIAAGLNQLTGLKDALSNVKAALGLSTTATVAATVANEGLAVSEGAAAVGAEGAAVATKSFTAALLSNPITAALVAIAALAGAYILLSDNAKDAEASIEDLNDQIDINTKLSEINQRVAEKTANSLSSQLEILKAQGASEDDIIKKEIELNALRERNARRQVILNESEIQSLEDRAAALAGNTDLSSEEYKKQSDVLFKRIDDLKNTNRGLKNEQESYRNDTLVKEAQFGKDQQDLIKENAKKQHELNLQKIQEETDLQFKLREIGISLINDEFEKRRQLLVLNFDKEIDVYAKKLEEKKITLEKFNIIFNKLNEQLQKNTDDINLDEIKSSAEAEKTLREKNLNEILAVIDNQNKSLETEEINGILERLKSKQAALKSQGFSEIEIARQSNIFIEEELKKSNVNRLKDDIETLEKKEAEIKSSGGSIVEIESQIAAKRIELNKETNKQIVDADAGAAQKRQDLALSIIDGFEKAGEIAAELFSIETAYAEAALERDRNMLDKRLEFLDEEDAANKDALDRRNIGERDFKEQEKKNLALRKAANDEFRKKEAEAKRKADVAERIQALFSIALNTAKNIVAQPGPLGALIPYWVGIGIVQAAAVIAKPLPTYFKGTTNLQRGMNPVGQDTIPIMAHEGEAIIPTDKNRMYKNTIEAVYHERVPSTIMESFVLNYNRGEHTERQTTVVNIDHKALAKEIGSELSYRLRGRDAVDIANLADLAALMVVNDGRRR